MSMQTLELRARQVVLLVLWPIMMLVAFSHDILCWLLSQYNGAVEIFNNDEEYYKHSKRK